MIIKLGGRKMILAVVCLIAGVAIDLETSRGLSENLLYLMLGLIGMFNAGNIGAKLINKEPKATAPAPAGDKTGTVSQKELENYVVGLMDEVQKNKQAIQATNNRVTAAISKEG